MFELKDIDFIEERGEHFSLSFVPSDKNLNVNGTVHGGIIPLLCDEAVGRYVTSLGLKGAAADANVHYYRPAFPNQVMKATIFERKVGRKLGVYQIEVTNPEGKLIADAMFTVAFA